MLTQLETEIDYFHELDVHSTRRGRICIDWGIRGKGRRIVIAPERVRELADLLHDAADQLEDRK